MVQGIDINKCRAKIFKALSDPIRLEIINLLRKKRMVRLRSDSVS